MQSTRTFRFRARWLVVGLALAVLGAGQTRPGPSRAAPAAPLPVGEWTTFANGDDVLALALDDRAEGETLWAGTRAGGVVRWDLVEGSYDQLLHPQQPLGGNTVRDIAIGADGRKWLATDNGLSVLDDRGTRGLEDDVWHTYNPANTGGGLSSPDLRALAVDGAFVWVAMAQVWDPASGAWKGGGVGRLDTKGTAQVADDTWAPVATFASTYKRDPDGTERFGLISDNVNDIALTPKGNLWAATSPHWSLEPDANPEDPPKWTLVRGGVSYLDTKGTADPADDKWTGSNCYDFQVTLTCQVQALAIDSEGWVWAATKGRGVVYFRSDEATLVDDKSRRVDLPDPVGGDSVEAIGFGPKDVPALKNTVWLARSKGGLSILNHKATLRNRDDDEWNFGLGEAFTTADGLARNRVQALAIGADGAKAWIGTGPAYGIAGGISPLEIKDVTFDMALVTRRAPPTNFITDIDFGQAGSVWEGHVWVATGSRAQRRFGAGVADLDTQRTADTADDAWITYSTLGTDPDGKAPWTGLVGDNVHTVKVQGGRVWFGSTESIWDANAKAYVDGGLTVYESGAWTARTIANTGGPTTGLRDGSITSLAEGCGGTLWVGTGNPWDALGAGVDVLTPGASVHQRTQDGWKAYSYTALASNNTTGLALDCQAQEAWVSAAHHISLPDEFGSPGGKLLGGGAARLDINAGKWTKYDTRSGLESYAEDPLWAEAMTVAIGPGGKAWVGAYGTKSTSNKALVEQRPYWPAVLNQWDGSAWSAAIYERAGMVSSIALDQAGRLWVATSRGGAARDSSTPDNWRVDRATGGLMVYPEASIESGPPTILRPETSGILSNDISVVAVAPNGDVWVGTEGWGLARYRASGIVPTPTTGGDVPTPGTPGPSATPTRTGGPASATPSRTGEVTPTPGTTTPRTRTPGTPPPNGLFLPFTMQSGRPAAPRPTRTPSPTGPTPTRSTPIATASAGTPATATGTATAGTGTPGTPGTPAGSSTPTPTRTASPTRPTRTPTEGPSPTASSTRTVTPTRPPGLEAQSYFPFTSQRRSAAR